MELIGLIILGIICFAVFGLLGHLMNLITSIIGWLVDGALDGIGCLIWIVIIVLVLMTF